MKSRRLGTAVAFVLSSVAASLVNIAAPAAACSCEPPPPESYRIGATDIAVAGHVLSVEPTNRTIPSSDRGAGAWLVATVQVGHLLGDHLLPSTTQGTIEVLTSRGSSSCGPGLAAGEDVAVLVKGVDESTLLYQAGCSTSGLTSIQTLNPDLSTPTAPGPARYLTSGNREGPSDIQLRDASGAVVAWGALPWFIEHFSICPGRHAAVVHRADNASRDVSVLDLRTFERTRSRELEQSAWLRAAACIDPDGDRYVVWSISEGETTTGVLEVIDVDGGRVHSSAPLEAEEVLLGVLEESVVIATPTELLRFDPDDAALEPIAAPELDSTEPTALVQQLNGSLALVSSSTDGTLVAVTQITDHGMQTTRINVAAQALSPVIVATLRGTLIVRTPDEILHLDSAGDVLDSMSISEAARFDPAEAAVGYSALGKKWIRVGIDADGDLSPPNDTTTTEMVLAPPAPWHATVTPLPPLDVSEETRAAHTRLDMKRLAAGSAGEVALVDAAGKKGATLLALTFAGVLLFMVVLAGARTTGTRRNAPSQE